MMIPSSHPAYQFPFRKHKGRHVVCIGAVRTDYLPINPWDIPDALENLHVLEARLSMAQGISLTRQFNREQMEKGIPGRLWAILIHNCRPRGPAAGNGKIGGAT